VVLKTGLIDFAHRSMFKLATRPKLVVSSTINVNVARMYPTLYGSTLVKYTLPKPEKLDDPPLFASLCLSEYLAIDELRMENNPI
jgi:hypothetical protein